jgi:hypothetical protein
MTRFSKKRMYEEQCIYDFDEEICREYAENEDLQQKGEEE